MYKTNPFAKKSLWSDDLPAAAAAVCRAVACRRRWRLGGWTEPASVAKHVQRVLLRDDFGHLHEPHVHRQMVLWCLGVGTHWGSGVSIDGGGAGGMTSQMLVSALIALPVPTIATAAPSDLSTHPAHTTWLAERGVQACAVRPASAHGDSARIPAAATCTGRKTISAAAVARRCGRCRPCLRALRERAA